MSTPPQSSKSDSGKGSLTELDVTLDMEVDSQPIGENDPLVVSEGDTERVESSHVSPSNQLERPSCPILTAQRNSAGPSTSRQGSSDSTGRFGLRFPAMSSTTLSERELSEGSSSSSDSLTLPESLPIVPQVMDRSGSNQARLHEDYVRDVERLGNLTLRPTPPRTSLKRRRVEDEDTSSSNASKVPKIEYMESYEQLMRELGVIPPISTPSTSTVSHVPPPRANDSYHRWINTFEDRDTMGTATMEQEPTSDDEEPGTSSSTNKKNFEKKQ